MTLKTDCEIRTIKQTMHCRNEEVLEYSISYPVFTSTVFFKSTQRINDYYRSRALSFECYCRTALYRMACEAAEESRKHGYPLMKFEAIQEFNVTYNENCAISLYTDRYMFTGGAHGATERVSETWELGNGGRKLGMADLFADNFPYQKYVIKEITGRIKSGAEKGEVYFDGYEQNVKDTFNSDSFYLTDDGLAVYFQQYDIAPYSSGIPVFIIPYSRDGAMPPRC